MEVTVTQGTTLNVALAVALIGLLLSVSSVSVVFLQSTATRRTSNRRARSA